MSTHAAGMLTRGDSDARPDIVDLLALRFGELEVNVVGGTGNKAKITYFGVEVWKAPDEPV